MAVVLALAVLGAACGRAAPAEPPGAAADRLVLRNFTLIDGTDRPPVADAAMIVESGRIAWIGPAAQLDAAGSPVTDLAGGYVIPGLINLHGHVGNTVDLKQDRSFHTRESVERDLGTYAAYGVTTVLSMGTDQDTIFAVREAQRDGRPATARVYTAGQGLVFEGGYGGLAGVNDPVATVEEARAAVDAQADKNVDVIKIWLDSELGTMPKMPPAMTQAIIEAAHRRNLRAVAHVFYLEDAKRLVSQGIDALVHSVRDQPVDQPLIDSMLLHGTWQAAATLSREAAMFAYGATPPFASDPFFTRAVSQTSLDLIRSPERQKTTAAAPHFKQFPAFFETAKANVKKLADAGVPIGFGTDAGPPGRFPGYAEHWELQLMVEAGFTPAQALRTATGRAAEFLRVEELGTLERGHWADLVVLERNPLDDIRNSRTIRAVYVAGREVPSINEVEP